MKMCLMALAYSAVVAQLGIAQRPTLSEATRRLKRGARQARRVLSGRDCGGQIA
jgi:hypothetical protein